MSIFDGIIGHDTIARVLEKALDKPAHGYLFCGPRGVGKTTVAERLAVGLLEDHATPNTQYVTQDGQHVSLLASHPDFVRLGREEGAREIVVKQVRELIARMQLTSARGGYKIALIEQADRLNEEAANALLKAVEEPSPKTVYIFIAEQPDRLPATLRSRLVKIEFGRVATKEIETWLSNHATRIMQHVSRNTYHATKNIGEIAKEARGCPGLAWRMAFGEEEAWHQALDWTRFMDSLLKEPLGKKFAVIEKIAQAVEAQDDVETAWREALERLMRALDARFVSEPVISSQLGKGLSHAWRLVGTAISPRLALEYALTSEEAKQGRMRPKILNVG